MLYLGSIGMDHVISESCFKGIILQRNNFFAILKRNNKFFCKRNNNFVVKFHSKKNWELHYSVIMRCVIKRLHCNVFMHG